MDISQLKITRDNVLGWLLFIRTICDDENDSDGQDVRDMIDGFLSRTDYSTRDKELDRLFGERRNNG